MRLPRSKLLLENIIQTIRKIYITEQYTTEKDTSRELRNLYAGIDIGSLVTKVVILNKGRILASSIVDSRSDPEASGNLAIETACNSAGINREDINYILATGYGRISLPFANRTATELSCHAKGAHYLCNTARTVIDVGGQDSKVLRIDSEGSLVDFKMNDKCAAGTGRFLEVMAQALEIDLKTLGEFSLHSNQPLHLSSTCTVFAETEVISLLASKRKKEDIAAGIHAAVARRVGNMVKTFGIEKDVVFVGGVAKNIGIKKALEDFLDVRFIELELDPQIVGALGAALLAKEFYQKE